MADPPGLPPAWAAEVTAMLEADGVPGGAITVVNGEHIFQHFHGVRRAGSPEPVTADTGFQLCSLTKAYVATLALALAHEGAVDLDSPIQPFVPELAFEPAWISAELNLRDLLSNRVGALQGGLADFGLHQRHGYPELVRRFSRMRRTVPFRTAFSYCNPGFTTAVLVLERATGRDFADLLRSTILAPAGMAQTSMGPAARAHPQRAHAHTVNRAGAPELVDEPDDWVRPGAGGLLSSARDQLRWVRLNLGRGAIDGAQVLPAELWNELWHPHIALRPGQRELWLGENPAFAAYALGWFVADYHSRFMAVHTGGGVGWRTRTVLLPDDGIGLSVLLNVDGKTGTAIQHRLLELCLGLPPKPWHGIVSSRRAASIQGARRALEADFPSTPHAPLPVAELAGRYHNPESGTALVAPHEGSLHITFEDADWAGGALLPLGGPVFEIAMTCGFATYDGPDAPLPRIRFRTTADPSFAHSSMGDFQRC